LQALFEGKAMRKDRTAARRSIARAPELSLVMPCYNEEEIVEYTIRRLIGAFDQAGYRLELVAVDNGSRDRTGEIINQLAAKFPGIVPHRVEKNEGFGHGVLSGIPLCTAPWVGMVAADGQVDAEDVVRLYEVVRSSNSPVFAKVRRRFRMDGTRRKIVSIIYNLLVQVLWPGVGSLDVNGNPRILPRDVVLSMGLKSKGWLLDPEMVIRAHHLGIPILEFNVFARMRSGGTSHVRAETCWEFLRGLLAARFTGAWRSNPEAVREQAAGLAVASGGKASL
jgi:glycosyltransferase involved in cell wall biosynthesis